MCGRYSLSTPDVDVARVLRAEMLGEGLPGPHWQIRPTDAVAVVVESPKQPGRRMEGARWDLARPWQRGLRRPGPPLINVRSETANEKFAWALQRRRCLLPANGYWEWTGPKGRRQPNYFRSRSDRVIAFAGLYSWLQDSSRDEDDPNRWMLTAALLTTAADERLSEIHDRTPLILPVEEWDLWLDPHTSGDQDLVDRAVAASRWPTADLEYYPVRQFGIADESEDLTTPLA
jgi:putative SOS response-associated peptidase YedK